MSDDETRAQAVRRERDAQRGALSSHLLTLSIDVLENRLGEVQLERELALLVDGLRGGGVTVAPGPLESWTLRELLENPETTELPPVVVPRLAWGERVTMLSAREKRGKSTLVAHGVAAASHGRAFLGEDTPIGKTLWVYYEGHKADVARTLATAHANPDRVRIAKGRAGEWGPLVELIGAEQPALVVIDTLASFAAGTLVKEFSRAEQWTPVMNGFAQRAQELHCAVVLIHHDKKTGGYADSRAIGAGCDMLLNLPGEPEDASPKRQLNGVGRWPYVNCAIRLDAGRYVLEDGIAGAPSVELRVLDFIRDHAGASKTDVRTFIGGRKDPVDEALTRLLSRGLIVNLGTETHHKYSVAGTAARDDEPATVPARHLADVADVAGQGLTQSSANHLARGGQPIGLATATVATENGTEPPRIHRCAGGCDTMFSRPGLTCHDCRRKAGAA